MFPQSGDEMWQRSPRLDSCNKFFDSAQTQSQNLMFHKSIVCDNYYDGNCGGSRCESSAGLTEREETVHGFLSESNIVNGHDQSYGQYVNDNPSHYNDHLLCFNVYDSNNNNVKNTCRHGQWTQQKNNADSVTPSSFANFHQTGRKLNESRIIMCKPESTVNSCGLCCVNHAKSAHYKPPHETSLHPDIAGNSAIFDEGLGEVRTEVPKHLNEKQIFSDSGFCNIPVITLDDDDDDDDEEEKSVSVPDRRSLQTAIQVSVIKFIKAKENVEKTVDFVDKDQKNIEEMVHLKEKDQGNFEDVLDSDDESERNAVEVIDTEYNSQENVKDILDSDDESQERRKEIVAFQDNSQENVTDVVNMEVNLFDTSGSCGFSGHILSEANHTRNESSYVKGIFKSCINICSTVIKKSTDQISYPGPPNMHPDSYFCVSGEFSKDNPLKESTLSLMSLERKLSVDKSIRNVLQFKMLNVFSLPPSPCPKLNNFQKFLSMPSTCHLQQILPKGMCVEVIEGYHYLVQENNLSKCQPACEGKLEESRFHSRENDSGVVAEASKVPRNVSDCIVGLYLVKQIPMKKGKVSANSKKIYFAQPSWLDTDLKLLFKKVDTDFDPSDSCFKFGAFSIEPILSDDTILLKNRYNVQCVNQSLKMLFKKQLWSVKEKSQNEDGIRVKYCNNLSTVDKKHTLLLAKRSDGFENVGQEPVQIILRKLGICGYPFLVGPEANCNANENNPNKLKNVQEVDSFNSETPDAVIASTRLPETIESLQADEVACANHVESEDAHFSSNPPVESQNNHCLPRQDLEAVTDNLERADPCSTSDVRTGMPYSKHVLFRGENLMLEDLAKKSSSNDILKPIGPNLADLPKSDSLKTIQQILKPNEDFRKNKGVIGCDNSFHQVLSMYHSKNQNPELNQDASDSAPQICGKDHQQISDTVLKGIAMAMSRPEPSKCIIEEEALGMLTEEKRKRNKNLSENPYESRSFTTAQTKNCVHQQLKSVLDSHFTSVISKNKAHVLLSECPENYCDNSVMCICSNHTRTEETYTNLIPAETITSEDSDQDPNCLHYQSTSGINNVGSTFPLLTPLTTYNDSSSTLPKNLKDFEKSNVRPKFSVEKGILRKSVSVDKYHLKNNVDVDKYNHRRNLSVMEYFDRKSHRISKKLSFQSDHTSCHSKYQVTSDRVCAGQRSSSLKRKRPNYSVSASSPCKNCQRPLDQHSPDGNCDTSGGKSLLGNVRTYYDPDCFVNIASSAMTTEDEDALARVVAERDVFVYSPRKPAARDPRLSVNTLDPYENMYHKKKVRFTLQPDIQPHSRGTKKRRKDEPVNHFNPGLLSSAQSSSLCHCDEVEELAPTRPSAENESPVKVPSNLHSDITAITQLNLEKLEVKAMKFSEKCEKYLREVETSPSEITSNDSLKAPISNLFCENIGLQDDRNFPVKGIELETFLKQSHRVERTAKVPVSPPQNNDAVYAIQTSKRYIVFSAESPTIDSSFEWQHNTPSMDDVEDLSEKKSRGDVPYSPGSPTSTIVMD